MRMLWRVGAVAALGAVLLGLGTATAHPPQEGGERAVVGVFEPFTDAPAAYSDVQGSATLIRSEEGTEAALIFIGGLEPSTRYLAHVHSQPCAEDKGGPHYRFVASGPPVPPNEIHLGFASNLDGSGAQVATNHMTAGPEAVSVVIHLATSDEKLACADLPVSGPE